MTENCLSDLCTQNEVEGLSSESTVSAGVYFGFCTLISHILLTGITVAIVYKCLVLKLVHTAGHAFYCTIGFVFFMGEALLVRNSQYLENLLGHLNLNRLHAILGLLAFVVGIGGVGIKTWQKLERKREDPEAKVRHFKSNHAFYGIVGCGLLLGSVISGVPLYFGASSSSTIKFLHRFFGLSGFLLLMVSQMFGYNTGFGRRQWKPHHQKLFKFFTFIATITTVNYEFRRFVRDIIVWISRGLFEAASIQHREDL
ncbi:uncharacterized protein Dwil_GK24658 [Drosophila willistoni]|uniref:ascorbate ferrireductase (transmembrane) n=1 Tax=Drosophila willistoni TaxID=7260 RepID=B4MZG7_DROWI|nr:uncharacterized protein LOC6644060 [Drosophila willistoni]EDW77752.1 uncharacterized protein Dwil_GK24658 [Drosophila willistoni]